MSNHSSSSGSVTKHDGQQENLNLSSASLNDIDQISSSSLDFLAKLNDSEPTHGLLVPSKKRTNSNFAFTMILRGHTYHVCYRRQTPRGERVYWRCQLRGQCKARLITDLDGKIVQFTNSVHSHPSSTRLNNQQQRCIQALLTTVEENMDLLKGPTNDNLLMPTSSSPDHEEFNGLMNGCTSNTTPPPIFESPNTSSTLSSNNDESQPNQKQARKRHKISVTKAQQTGEIDIEEVLRQIPQLQSLRFANYYNEENEEGNDDDEDENNNENEEGNVKETDETVYEDTDSSSIASPSHLIDTQRRSLLDSLSQAGWSNSTSNGRDQIQKTFEFLDFNETFGFMNRVALKAEAVHRHPKWTNIYNRLEISLPANPQQHTLTIADLHLAKFMDEIYHHH